MKKICLVVLGSVVSLLVVCGLILNQQLVFVVECMLSIVKLVDVVVVLVVLVLLGCGYYMVKKGDILYCIVLDVGQNWCDIVVWNNLINLNDIKVDQVLCVVLFDCVGLVQMVIVVVVLGVGLDVKLLGVLGVVVLVVVLMVLGSNKIGLCGDKCVYLESVLVELEKFDVVLVVVFVVVFVVVVKLEVLYVVDKLVVVSQVLVVSDDEGVIWMWLVDGKVVGIFEGGKKGVDIVGKDGQVVLVVVGGKVMYVGSGICGYGNLVIIKYINNLLLVYVYNKIILVKEGQVVIKGQKIVEMGKFDSDSVKLYFEICQQGKFVDFLKYLLLCQCMISNCCDYLLDQDFCEEDMDDFIEEIDELEVIDGDVVEQFQEVVLVEGVDELKKVFVVEFFIDIIQYYFNKIGVKLLLMVVEELYFVIQVKVGEFEVCQKMIEYNL